MNTREDKVWMRQALRLAQKAKAEGELPFGAVVVCDHAVIGEGRCSEKADQSVTAHAELQAVHQSCKQYSTNLSCAVIYCTNEPCLMCAGAIFQARISRVVIGASRDDLPQILQPRKLRIDDVAADSNYSVIIERGLEKDAVLKLFDGVFR